jgi:MFS family permease
LFLSRFTRLFAYGSLSVILVFYLVSLGLTERQVGILLTLTLTGDLVISLLLTTRADSVGRRRILMIGAALMTAAGVAFVATRNLVFLLVAATVGVISPSGNEVGPFLSIEQAALSQVVSPRVRTEVFAWYTFAGSLATALGALSGGTAAELLQRASVSKTESYRAVVLLYAGLGLVLAFLFARLSSAAEIDATERNKDSRFVVRHFLGIGQSLDIILKLSSLFALDSFAGGFVIQSFAAYWFYLRFSVDPARLGMIFFSANILAGASSLVASRLASRFGLVRTMVFTHLPSNVLLILVPLMPNLPLAVLLLLVRFSISQMDVPTRQSYTMAVVRPEERSAAGGVAGAARTAGAAISPAIAGFLFSNPKFINVPFFLAGALKILYDLVLYTQFMGVRPPEEAD